MTRLPAWVLIVLALLVALAEGIAIGTKEAGDTITERVIETFPPVVVAAFAGWLAIHFGRRAWAKWRDR